MSIQMIDFENSSRVLHALLLRVGGGPEEKHALELALKALLFAVSRHGTEFDAFVQSVDEPLSTEEREHLRTLGL